MGPFYCPADRKVYLDLSFWQELEGKFGAGGEAARAYVIAHEIGHHVQHLTGATEQAQRMGMRGAESGAVRLELQADCYAGVWAHHAARAGQLEVGDLEEGIAAAEAVGDDRLQSQATGRVMPDSFTHGSSARETSRSIAVLTRPTIAKRTAFPPRPRLWSVSLMAGRAPHPAGPGFPQNGRRAGSRIRQGAGR